MCGAGSGTLLFDSDWEKIEREIRKRIREAKEAANVPLPCLSDFSSDEEEEIMEWITLWDYGRLGNLDEVDQGFQLAKHVFFDIKNLVLSAPKVN